MAKLTEELEKLTPLQRAIFALKETQARLDALEQQRSEPIAVVGMACRFPGQVTNPATYWDLLREGREAIRETPRERWDAAAYFDPDPQAPGKLNSRYGGYLDDVGRFDNAFFGISDREAEYLDPQQRMLLELAWEAFEDAGLPPAGLRGSKVGVFIGISVSDYAMLMSGHPEVASAYFGTGTSLSIAANRLSFAFDLQGPSVAIDTACSSSLVALHLACQSLRQGESALALVGGTNLVLSPFMLMNLTKAGMLSSGEHLRAFDAGSSGFLRSDGAATVVLKPLRAAVADGDPVQAIIRGSAVNTSGQSNGLSAPSRAAQQAVLREAYAAARISPALVQYIEAQGTGTLLGDAIEAQALGTFLASHRSPASPLPIGSVKTNLGHTEAASGLASLIKVILAMRHGQLPPTLHFESPNPNIPFDRLPIRVQTQLEPWTAVDGRRIAGVSAFGFGGSNAHVVVEQSAAQRSTAPGTGAAAPPLLLLSAKTESALVCLAGRYAEYLRQAAHDWSDICYTAAVRREHLDCRLAVPATSNAEAAKLLDKIAHRQGLDGTKVMQGRRPFAHRLRLAYWFGNQAPSAHWRTSLEHLPVVRQWLAEADQLLVQHGLAPLAELERDGHDELVDCLATVIQQLTLVVACRALGLMPQAAVGCGRGELAAAVAAGSMEPREALRALLRVARRDAEKYSWNGDRPITRSPDVTLISAAAPQTAAAPSFELDTCLRRTLSGAFDAAHAVRELASRQLDVLLVMGEHAAERSAGGLENLPRVMALAPAAADRGRLVPALAQLFALGAEIDWKTWYVQPHVCVSLPTYAWQGKRHWLAAARPAAVQRTATSAPSPAARQPRPELAVPYVEAQGPLQRAMARAWCELLKLESVGIHDNFFELGGDSLQATLLRNQVQQRLGEPIPAMVLFEAHTIHDLARYLEANFPDAVQRAFAEGETWPLVVNELPARPREGSTIQAQPRAVNAEQLLERLDDLSDEEVERLLQENLPTGEEP